MSESKTCKSCGRSLPPSASSGHRKREYCDDTCRQTARRSRLQEQRRRQCGEQVRSWGTFQPATVEYLAGLLFAENEESEKAARRLAGIIREEQGSLAQMQERYRAYVAMTNERLETLTGELAAARQELAHELQMRLGAAHNRIAELESSKRDSLAEPLCIDEALLEIGRRLGWPRLDFARYGDGVQVHIKAGELYWTNFSLRADCCEVKIALEVARKRDSQVTPD